MTIKTILIVDDEKLMRALLRHYCKQNGFEVVEAENGEEALHRLGEKRPDLVIMDAMMPVMNGLIAGKKIRELSNVPIIALSAYASEQEAEKCLRAGFSDYLAKPFKPEELKHKVFRLASLVR